MINWYSISASKDPKYYPLTKSKHQVESLSWTTAYSCYCYHQDCQNLLFDRMLNARWWFHFWFFVHYWPVSLYPQRHRFLQTRSVRKVPSIGFIAKQRPMVFLCSRNWICKTIQLLLWLCNTIVKTTIELEVPKTITRFTKKTNLWLK